MIRSTQVDELFARGEFNTIARLWHDSRQAVSEASPNTRVQVAASLAFVADPEEALLLARPLALLSDKALQCHAELVVGIAAWRSGDVVTALPALQKAIRLSAETKDRVRRAWCHLHLLRFYIDFQPSDSASSWLGVCRRVTNEAGSAQTSAYLHCCVATFEGQRGNLGEAYRHCDLAQNLLESEPHAWILAAVYRNRGSIEALRFNFKEAHRHFQRVEQLATGPQSMWLGIEGSRAHLSYQAGRFDEAKAILKKLLEGVTASKYRKDPARETLARVHLALGELNECEAALAAIGIAEAGANPSLPEYVARWGLVTKLRLMAARGDTQKASGLAQTIWAHGRGVGDHAFDSAVATMVSKSRGGCPGPMKRAAQDS